MATIRDDAFLLVTQDGVNYKIKKSELQTIFNDALSAKIASNEVQIESVSGAVDDNLEAISSLSSLVVNNQDSNTNRFDAIQAEIDDNKVHSDIQVTILQEEIEQLRPTLDRGSWEFQTTWDYDVQLEGKYALRLENSTDLSDGWNDVGDVHITDQDVNQILHDFSDDINDYEGTYLDIFNQDDDGYAIFKITGVGDIGDYTHNFEVELVQAKGAPSGKASLQFFTLDDDLSDDLGNYLRNTGGELTGKLDINAGSAGKAIQIGGADPSRPTLELWNTGAVATSYTNFKDNELITKSYVDSKFTNEIEDQLKIARESLVGRRFKYAGSNTQPRDKDGYIYAGSNYFFLSNKDLDGVGLQIHPDYYPDIDAFGSNFKAPVSVYTYVNNNWSLYATGYWPVKIDAYPTYLYIKNITWTNKKGYSSGTILRVSIAPFF